MYTHNLPLTPQLHLTFEMLNLQLLVPRRRRYGLPTIANGLVPKAQRASKTNSSIHVHLLPNPRLSIPNILHGNILRNLLLRYNLLVQHRRRAPLEAIIPHLLLPDIGLDVIPQQLRLLLRDDAHIHITARTQVVPDARLNRLGTDLHRIIPGQVAFPLRLEHTHRRQRTGSHRHVR